MYNNQGYNPNLEYYQGPTEDKFRPMSSWGHIGYDFLFRIPLLGLIMLFVFSFNDDYIARRNYARSKFCKFLVLLPIYIIMIIILAAIVLNTSTSTVSNAQYARFAQEFGDYSDQVIIDAAYVRQKTGLKGQNIKNAQMFYMTAHGYDDQNQDGVKGYNVPAGYELTINNYDFDEDTLSNILNSSNYSSYYSSYSSSYSSNSDDDVVAYVINDKNTSYASTASDNNDDGSASREFYGDSNGKEYHFITSDGNVFTLPGYPVPQADGTIEYHIDTKYGHYYVVQGNSGKSLESINVNGDTISATRPIQASDLTRIKGIDENGNVVTKLADSEPKTNIIGN